MKKKTITLIILLVLLATGVFLHIYFNYLKTDKYYEPIVALDRERSLLFAEYDSEKGDRQDYVIMSHCEKGVLWKTPIDGPYEGYLYEQRYHRDVMEKDGTVSYYSPQDQLIYKLDSATGEILDQEPLSYSNGVEYNRWASLQDGNTLYFLNEVDDIFSLSALDYDTFDFKWTCELPERTNGKEWVFPVQDDRNIVLHREKYRDEPEEIILIRKETGDISEFTVDDWGIYRQGFYYAPSLFEGQWYLECIDTDSAERMRLYSLPGLQFESKVGSSLWLYEDSLLYFSDEDSRIVLNKVRLSDGSPESSLPMPEDYRLFAGNNSLFIRGAPEFNSYPYVKTPFLPIILGYTGPESFSDTWVKAKLAVLDLERGEIAWQTKPVYQRDFYLEDSQDQDDFYDDGIYGFFFPIPERDDDEHNALLLIDGVSGELRSCMRIVEKKDDDPIWESQFAYGGRYQGDGRLFSLSPGAHYMADGSWIGRESRKYYIEDLREEMGTAYGF
ncbi:MAG: hypothetical protein PQJ59_06060 [Spirochaetales bacterium]|nr:hypothetical protein [Spirochaetales bacterium]